MKTNLSLTGKIVKIHSDFIYVKSADIVYECKIRERLKKEKTEIFTGDNVRIEEINSVTNQAVVVEALERKNYLVRPSVANVDQVIAVAALSQPGLDFIQLNRYLCMAKLHNIPALICINKIDLEKNKENLAEKIQSIYEPLNYQVVFTSAMDGSGFDFFQNYLSGKISVLAGMSGVGKSSLLNKLCPDLNLRTKKVSSKSGKGIHTTRHTELIEIYLPEKDASCQIADTPGFSYLKFDNILPSEVMNLFDEIKNFSEECYYSDCLHLEEENCNVINNLDKIDETRYLSYKTFVKEAFEYKKQLENTGQKQESAIKTIDSGGKGKTRLFKAGIQAKEDSRKKSRQKINPVSIMDDVYYNREELDS
ncbi:MAG TPA: ribosome small subunit-dependent GTPase A [Candidatus Gastranaerophilales bacterium]|nr:ribosome small subunit-dependent GTPase A [Candidatus Gastranaerophilales bacterium]